MNRKPVARMARPLLAAGVGIAAAVYASCGGGLQPPMGNLKPPPACDAGCLPDGGYAPDAGAIGCSCTPSGG